MKTARCIYAALYLLVTVGPTATLVTGCASPAERSETRQETRVEGRTEQRQEERRDY